MSAALCPLDTSFRFERPWDLYSAVHTVRPVPREDNRGVMVLQPFVAITYGQYDHVRNGDDQQRPTLRAVNDYRVTVFRSVKGVRQT